jgi:hypothetical protein
VSPSGRRFHFVHILNDLQNPTIFLADRSAQLGGGEFNYVPITYGKYELLSGHRFSDGNYFFNTPIKELSTITLSIADPLNPITLIQDTYFNVTVSNIVAGNPGGFTLHFKDKIYIPISTVIKSLFISGFTTTLPLNTSDATLISYLNNNEHTGCTVIDDHTIAVDNKIHMPGFQASLSYRLNVDITPIGDVLPFTVTLGGYRAMANLEVTYIE